jgi:hypothetical protein
MAPPPINTSTKYKAKGKTKIYWVPTIANVEAPTRVELDAGVDLSPQIMETDGWEVTSESIETPNLADEFTGSIPGSTSADDSSLTMYSDEEGDDVRQVLPRNTNGYVVILHGGDVAGRPTMDVFPVRVGSLGKPVSLDDDASSITVNFNITDEPQENLTIPA